MQAFALSLIAFAGFLLLTVAVFRIVDVTRTMHALVTTFVIVLTASVGFACVFFRGVDFLAFFSVYVCLFLIFVQIFSVFYKSISLRLVLDIRNRQGDRAPLEWVYAECIVAGSFRRRLDILEASGLISRELNVITLTPAGRRTADRLLTAQKILGIEKSG
jgi:hypothetical protein